MNDDQRRAMFAKRGNEGSTRTTGIAAARPRATGQELIEQRGEEMWYEGRGGYEGWAHRVERSDLNAILERLEEEGLTASTDDLGMDAVVYDVRKAPSCGSCGDQLTSATARNYGGYCRSCY